jgi:hypothetical protein
MLKLHIQITGKIRWASAITRTVDGWKIDDCWPTLLFL